MEFSSVCCFIAMYVSISLLRNVEGGDPSPHASKKQKKCGSCHSFLTDLDPHSECNKRGNQLRGGTSLGRYAQRFHLPPKLFSPGRLRLASLEAEFSSKRRTSLLYGNSFHVHKSHGTPHGVPTPQISKPAGPVYKTGVLTVVRFFPSRETGGPPC